MYMYNVSTAFDGYSTLSTDDVIGNGEGGGREGREEEERRGGGKGGKKDESGSEIR